MPVRQAFHVGKNLAETPRIALRRTANAAVLVPNFLLPPAIPAGRRKKKTTCYFLIVINRLTEVYPIYEYPLVTLALAATVKACAQLTNGTHTPADGAF